MIFCFIAHFTIPQQNYLSHIDWHFLVYLILSLQLTLTTQNWFCRLDEKDSSVYRWILISWSPDSSSVRNKMLYASTKSSLKQEFGGGQIKDDVYGNIRVRDDAWRIYLLLKILWKMNWKVNCIRQGAQDKSGQQFFFSLFLKKKKFEI